MDCFVATLLAMTATRSTSEELAGGAASHHGGAIAGGMVKSPEVLVSQALAGFSRHPH